MGEKPERDAEIVRLHLEELQNYVEVGEVVGVSRERVRQVLRREGVTPEESAVIRRIRTVERWRCEVCGREGWRRDPKMKQYRTCAADCRGELLSEIKGIHDPEDLLDELVGLALEVGRTPGQTTINERSRYSHMSYVNYWGSLTAAQKAAGLIPNSRGRTSPLPPELAALTNGDQP